MESGYLFTHGSLEMYPSDHQDDLVRVRKSDQNLCGKSRTNHVSGLPRSCWCSFEIRDSMHVAIMREKDYQQLSRFNIMLSGSSYECGGVGCAPTGRVGRTVWPMEVLRNNLHFYRAIGKPPCLIAIVPCKRQRNSFKNWAKGRFGNHRESERDLFNLNLVRVIMIKICECHHIIRMSTGLKAKIGYCLARDLARRDWLTTLSNRHL